MHKNITGIIIGAKNSSDANRVIEVLTENDGSVYVLASGARRLSSRFMSLTGIYSVVALECVQNGNMLILRDGKLLGSYRSIAKDVEKFELVADAIKNARVAMQGFDDKQKLYALVMAYLALMEKCPELAEAPETSIFSTVKLYIYMLHYMGYDVPAYAEQREYGLPLVKVCESLSGKKISEVMMEPVANSFAIEAYSVLREIYSDELEMKLINIMSL